MKVYIGPFRNFVGPYQLADLLQHVGVSEDRCDDIGMWLSGTWVNTVFQWIHDRKKRKVSIKLHKYDTWNMDGTLSMIILPMLKQLQVTKHGAPIVDDEDVPEHLQSTATPPKKNEWDTDENHFNRWDWVMAEMIWTFEQLQPDYDWEAQYTSGEMDVQWVDLEHKDANGKPIARQMVRGPNDTYKVDVEGRDAHQARISNGLRLFGKYYQSLWD